MFEILNNYIYIVQTLKVKNSDESSMSQTLTS